MTKANLTPEQLEPLLSKQIEDLYFNVLQHQLSEIAYKWFDDKLVVIIEGTVTQAEKLLYQSDRKHLARQVRSVINKIILPQIKSAIEEVTNATVGDFLGDTTIDTGRTGAIAIFTKLEEALPSHGGISLTLEANTSGSPPQKQLL
jgi:uncharacterized protein YbcI